MNTVYSTARTRCRWVPVSISQSPVAVRSRQPHHTTATAHRQGAGELVSCWYWLVSMWPACGQHATLPGSGYSGAHHIQARSRRTRHLSRIGERTHNVATHGTRHRHGTRSAVMRHPFCVRCGLHAVKHMAPSASTSISMVAMALVTVPLVTVCQHLCCRPL